MGRELRLFLVALQFLTRVPVPASLGYSAAWLQASVRHFPAVGLLVGAFAALVLWAAAHLWPAAVAVALSMGATVWLTGAFHEDGLADTCDALGGAVSRERALEIMKDSRLGSYGTIGLVAVLGLKAAALYGLAVRDLDATLAALPLAHALSRAAPVLLLRLLPYAGDAAQAKAKPMATTASDGNVAVALLWCVVAAALACAWHLDAAHVLLAALAAAVVAFAMARWLRLRLGGFTGDTLGAAQQGAELAVYLALLAALSNG
jgi:adenosylcobinamide-GDP ribazoletransferase